MADIPYSNRELDAKFNNTNVKIDELTQQVTLGFKGIHKRQDYANGKVNKIVLGLTLAFGLIIGLGFRELAPALSLVL